MIKLTAVEQEGMAGCRMDTYPHGASNAAGSVVPVRIGWIILMKHRMHGCLNEGLILLHEKWDMCASPPSSDVGSFSQPCLGGSGCLFSIHSLGELYSHSVSENR